jgi:hypothetical protein
VILLSATCDEESTSDVTSTDGSTEQSEAQLLVYKLVYFPTFDNYFRKTKASKSPVLKSGKSTLEDKVNAVLQARLANTLYNRVKVLDGISKDMQHMMETAPTIGNMTINSTALYVARTAIKHA